MHIEFLVEEESAEAALQLLVPKIVGPQVSFHVHSFQGKRRLLDNLAARLRGYREWLPDDWRILILVDADREDCRALKARIENTALNAGFNTASSPATNGIFHLINRLAIEELEAWFFGDVDAIRSAYPGVPETLSNRRGFRDPDAIAGGTWEALERVLQKASYYRAGLPKIEVARNVSRHMEPNRNRSRSFQLFRDALRRLVQ